MTTFTIIMIVAVLVLCWVLKTLWGSPLFWISALALTIILWPITAGLSPIALFTLIVLRIVLVSKALTTRGGES